MRVHDSQAYRKMDVTRERIRLRYVRFARGKICTHADFSSDDCTPRKVIRHVHDGSDFDECEIDLDMQMSFLSSAPQERGKRLVNLEPSKQANDARSLMRRNIIRNQMKEIIITMIVVVLLLVLRDNFCISLFSKRNEVTALYTFDTASVNNKTKKIN